MEVRKTICDASDVWPFINTTKRFGKKFYSIKREKIEENLYLKFVVVAISRSLTYLLYWSVLCNPEDPSTKPSSTIPYIPTKKEDLETLLPYLSKDDPTDIFEANSFVSVGSIFDKDGRNLTAW